MLISPLIDTKFLSYRYEGRHMCLGANLAIAEAKVFLAVLARGFEFEIQNCDCVKLAKFPFPVPELKSVKFGKRVSF